MAFCGNYKDMKKRRPHGATTVPDSALRVAVRRHQNSKFWDAYRHDPDRYAYIRRWSSVIRREARQRGLL